MISWSEGSSSESSDIDVSSPMSSSSTPPLAFRKVPKCSFEHWVDPQWLVQLKMSVVKLWDMYEDENTLRLRQNVLNAEENLRVLKEKENM
ncbi:putative disease resistance protein RGA4 [Hordeum vulgare]|nr:putative disease resistance protein RGA4 [Hordeum vulgare]